MILQYVSYRYTSLDNDIFLDAFALINYQINYQIKINQHYDFGIYSDMSAIRKNMRPYLQNKTSLLNLFSYTGAFSIFCMGMNYTNVVKQCQ